MDVLKTYLHDNWEFAFAADGVLGDQAAAAADACAELVYRPARVPGTNLTDLQAAELVECATSATYEDSFSPYRFMDFVYRTRFVGGAAALRKHVYLCSEGLDTVCEVYLNGQRLAYCEDAHLGYEWDVAGRLSQGENELLILFRSPMREMARRQQAYGIKFPQHLDLDFMFLRKPAYSFFWDSGPKMPVSGIYRPLYLKSFDRAEIAEYQVRYAVAGQDVTGTVMVVARGADGATASVDIAGRHSTAEVVDGTARVPFAVPAARLWYPNGEGEAFLYDLEIRLENGTTLDSRQQCIGFRTIELVRDARKDGRGTRFVFKVNGREIFCRGYNWVPVDNSLPRGYYDQYRGNLDLARAGRANMLRIWGGGFYEDDVFYRLCDERGILVWQDAAFACSFYPDTDPAFMALVERELVYNLKRLRNFTSLALWCGENESHWGFQEWWPDRTRFPRFYGTHIYDELFPALASRLDPDRPYWNGSPYSEEPDVKFTDQFHGDSHIWDLHTNCGDFAGYLATAPSFVSETGMQSLPDLRTALTIGGPEDRHIQSFVFETRNHIEMPSKSDRLLKFAAALFRLDGDFARSVVLTQLGHAEYLKYAVEHWRSLAFDCAGALIWQINDCWPAISWSAVDYNLLPKASFYYLQRAFAADLVGFKQQYAIDYNPQSNARGELFVASDRDGEKVGVVELRVLRVTGELLETQCFPVALAGRGAVSLGELALPDYKARRFDCVAEFTLRWQDGTVARNVYPFSRPKHMHMPAPHIELAAVAPDSFTVCSDVFAKGVYLYYPDFGIVFDDNYFDLLPGERRLIQATQPIQVERIRVIAYHHDVAGPVSLPD